MASILLSSGSVARLPARLKVASLSCKVECLTSKQGREVVGSEADGAFENVKKEPLCPPARKKENKLFHIFPQTPQPKAAVGAFSADSRATFSFCVAADEIEQFDENISAEKRHFKEHGSALLPVHM